MKIMFSIPFKTFNTNKITIMSNYLDYKMSNKLFLKIKMKEEIHKSVFVNLRAVRITQVSYVLNNLEGSSKTRIFYFIFKKLFSFSKT